MPNITREQAFKIAESYLIAHPQDFEGRTKISEVFSIEEYKHLATPNIFNFPDEKMKNYWIAYTIDNSRYTMLRSSIVVLVHKESGSVDYAGSANDEG